MPSVASRPPETPAEVWAQMREFVDRHSPRHQLRAQLGEGLGKGRKKIMVLVQLAAGPLTAGEIAEAHGIDRPYATAIIDQLETDGLAERTTDPADRRRKLIALTPKGHAAAVTATQIIQTPPAALAELTRAELTQLGAILARLTAA
ncbi:MarR family winged helix-turn-helix transcriptional regulator [Actinoplanes sp. KI2]|uniref:MarR family winged helix-turn-helix transcriptional regulator n=1 Tax=Actinoplanes sp. KI2 TaxID=2983315 RepID=UPI002950046D|nr:MarR family transcriptional regulator [Actinoplanes sp. KI2]